MLDFVFDNSEDVMTMDMGVAVLSQFMAQGLIYFVFSDSALGPLSNNSSPAFALNATNANKLRLEDESKHGITARAV
ncbi:hypothetical protein HBI56_228970 [Parastagonospora nodorum]|nr:hypothetical protein HBH54_174140 [Parastagonospora nodorum]KAH4000419.1 hypothetical protein HBI10_098430 [Parastagonospora nodorum]KAH4051704.1 hypothetical protein HBH49_106950 [Parastagonospora nodorum]KAH4132399.1 hypothetical protein HBH45_177850 [Parastagonospora nodorum]KAH4155214.1 hypothetical protein HBH43_213630 [Parastagonospora nodorum]